VVVLVVVVVVVVVVPVGVVPEFVTPGVISAESPASSTPLPHPVNSTAVMSEHATTRADMEDLLFDV